MTPQHLWGQRWLPWALSTAIDRAACEDHPRLPKQGLGGEVTYLEPPTQLSRAALGPPAPDPHSAPPTAGPGSWNEARPLWKIHPLASWVP